ncbi:RagB/SusD family nutrient uptake outer membrane protein, partial [Parapedobacter sp. SGR-10]|uniref:RagB/SusD family nutrient uptake outer membrane protein n=1 Tax=Parapedobacter sp. SGR-10 TaxID=2710879 RepID=UPI0013D75B21
QGDGIQGKGLLDGPFYGMDMDASTLEGFYKRTVIVNRMFKPFQYLLPIPINEIFKSKVLVQNPGYDTGN